MFSGKTALKLFLHRSGEGRASIRVTASISYEPFDKLINSLRLDGLLTESDLLLQLINETAWTTGSELIGELGKTITQIRRENRASLSDDSKKHMRDAMEIVKRVWPDFPE
jgi:hypothetical protein